ncbi:NERD domain-containing protein [Frisingicoccus sp.]|uniref:nuclease-related domain-containing DEAD/DEAH box helicase n=1 Tax=Frisingicoccus sp. TaxID=1918627 RepID=UPI003AB8BA7E
MAIMIPETPHIFEPASQEGLMFDALTLLPDDYYVFHSFRISTVQDNTFHESETDFVIFHKKHGVICLEAKAGHIKYKDGYWYYASGIPMHNDGPFNQASSNKWKLIKYIKNSKACALVDKCKFLHAVWFPSVSDNELRSMTLPPEADKALVLTKEALADPEKFLTRIYSIELPNRIETNLTEAEAQKLIREIFCPQFNVFPSASLDSDLKKLVFHRLLREQAGILNFLEDQRSASINGAAGTGKTMIAIEKAQRNAAENQSTLFLCYNSQLKNFLSENYSNPKIHYYTIAGLACKLCNTTFPDYKRMKNVLEDMYFSGAFPYDHVVVDEGQDFGSEILEQTDILQLIHDLIIDNEEKNGTFYVFYDRLQLIQADKIPQFIEDSDCKLTLYRNCRNTENIAVTSLRPISERKPKLLENAVKGTPAKIHFCDTEAKAMEELDMTIDNILAEGFKDVVILTCKTEDSSLLKSGIKDGRYRNKYRFTTCRKFKGLEADAIILIDVDGESFNPDNVLIYYVGTSRARLRLDVITMLSDEECLDILQNTLKRTGKIRKPRRELASALNAIGTVTND